MEILSGFSKVQPATCQAFVPGAGFQAPLYGPPAAASGYPSYPVITPFTNRQSWTAASATAPPIAEPMQLGPNIFSSGEDLASRYSLSFNRWFNEDNGEIFIGPPKSMSRIPHAAYTDETFKTPIDRTENKVSTGVMVNPYTGEMFETFENTLPPPTTDKSLAPQTFEVVNPRLLQMQGGFNHHAPQRTKVEVSNALPDESHGPNVWGDQLYENFRGNRMREIAAREVWMNRNGDFPSPDADGSSTGYAAGFAREKPAGFLGLNPQFRHLPYLPPTQELDNLGYMPLATPNLPEANQMKAQVSVSKPDLTWNAYRSAVEPIRETEARMILSDPNARPTTRGGEGSINPHTVGLQSSTEGGIILQSSMVVKPTLKTAMEEAFTTGNMQSTMNAPYVVTQFQAKPTLKTETMEAPRPVHNLGANVSGSYVVSQFANKPALKTDLAEKGTSWFNMTPWSLGDGAGASYVVTQFSNKPTLKQNMETEIPVQVLQSTAPESSYVQLQEQNRPALKGIMQQEFGVGALTTTEGMGNVVDFQGELLEVARSHYELSLIHI